MDVLLSRILKYLNGALVYDEYYKFCTYVVAHYLEMENMTLGRITREAGISEESVLFFISRLGFHGDWDAFHEKFMHHHYTRLDQIRGRMIGLSSRELLKTMPKDMSDDEMLDYISTICEQIDQHKRTILIGALYPMSIAVEFQTDLITFGCNIVQFHAFDPNMQFTADDMIIFISATGRAMRGFLNTHADKHPENAASLLITQNPVYTLEEHKISDYVLKVPGRYDGLDFNYQLMHIFDLLRIHYYQKYYLGDR
jgi:DNA-binding MurR/RpiR family transcriptional regulator